MVDVFMHDLMAGIATPRSQFTQLVLGVLASIVGRYSGVDRNSHGRVQWHCGNKGPDVPGVIGNMRRLILVAFAAPLLTTLFPATSFAAPIHFWNRWDRIDQNLESDLMTRP